MLEITYPTNIQPTGLKKTLQLLVQLQHCLEKGAWAFFLRSSRQASSMFPKNINGNINWTKIKASRAQESTKFIPKKTEKQENQKWPPTTKVYVNVILGNRACAQKRHYIIWHYRQWSQVTNRQRNKSSQAMATQPQISYLRSHTNPWVLGSIKVKGNGFWCPNYLITKQLNWNTWST